MADDKQTLEESIAETLDEEPTGDEQAEDGGLGEDGEQMGTGEMLGEPVEGEGAKVRATVGWQKAPNRKPPAPKGMVRSKAGNVRSAEFEGALALPPDERRCQKILDPQTGRRCPGWTTKFKDENGKPTGGYDDFCSIHGEMGVAIRAKGNAAYKTLWDERRAKANELEGLRSWDGYQTFLISLIRDEMGKDQTNAKAMSGYLTRLEKTLEATQIPPVFLPSSQPGGGDSEETYDIKEALALEEWTDEELHGFTVHGIWPANRPRPGLVVGWGEGDGSTERRDNERDREQGEED